MAHVAVACAILPRVVDLRRARDQTGFMHARDRMSSISAIVPCYNGEAGVNELHQAIRRLQGGGSRRGLG